MQGELEYIYIAELVQLLSVSKKNGRLDIIHRDGRDGKLFFEEGELVHSVCGSKEGMDALVEIFSWNNGEFQFIPDVKSDRITINIPTIQAMMECAAILDEQKENLDSEVHKQFFKPKLIKKEGIMTTSDQLQMLQEQLSKELPGFLACAVISVEEGLPLAGTSSIVDFDVSVPAGAFADAFKSVSKAYYYSNWGKVEELLFTGPDAIVVLVSLKGGAYYQVLAVKSNTTVGMVKAVYSKFKTNIENLLDKL